jgi:hypothetical protein
VPIPTAIAVDPTPIITIGSPCWVSNGNGGSPAPTVIGHMDPGPVRLKLFLEIFRGHGGGRGR